MTELFTGRPKIIVEPPQNTEPRGTYDLNTALQNISFSGADAVATMIIPVIGEDGKITNDGDVIELGELQTLSYSIHRENSPVRTLGHVNVRGFIKGGRTIAGSLIFTVFNEYAFYKIKKYRELLARRNGFFAPLADMLPPFDIVISFFNEYGQSAKMKIFGITIVDEGQTVSIEDIITEQTYTYMARGIQPMVKMDISSEIGSTKDPAVTQRDVQISRNIFGDEAVDKISEFYNQNMIERIVRQ